MTANQPQYDFSTLYHSVQHCLLKIVRIVISRHVMRDWYYNDVYCESVGYNEVKCNEQIDKLELIEEEYIAMSGYDEINENAVVPNDSQ